MAEAFPNQSAKCCTLDLVPAVVDGQQIGWYLEYDGETAVIPGTSDPICLPLKTDPTEPSTQEPVTQAILDALPKDADGNSLLPNGEKPELGDVLVTLGDGTQLCVRKGSSIELLAHSTGGPLSATETVLDLGSASTDPRDPITNFKYSGPSRGGDCDVDIHCVDGQLYGAPEHDNIQSFSTNAGADVVLGVGDLQTPMATTGITSLTNNTCRIERVTHTTRSYSSTLHDQGRANLLLEIQFNHNGAGYVNGPNYDIDNRDGQSWKIGEHQLAFGPAALILPGATFTRQVRLVGSNSAGPNPATVTSPSATTFIEAWTKSF